MSLLLVDLFLGILSTMGLLLVGALTERRKSAELLAEANVELEKKVQDRTQELSNKLEEVKRMQQYIVTKEKLVSLGTLAAGVAHEIKNPLNFITNFSEISVKIIDQLKEKEGASEEFNNLKLNVSKILEHAHRANETVQAMLVHSRERAGEFQETDINAVIQEYGKLTFHSKKQKNPDLHANIRCVLDESMKPIYVNKQEISRVILNLLDNAFDAVEEKKGGWERNIHRR